MTAHLAALSGNTRFMIALILWAVTIGLFFGGIGSLYSKAYLGSAVRALIRRGAVGKQNAVLLSETGKKNNFFMRTALRDGAPLRKHIYIANSEECTVYKQQSAFSKKIRKFFTGDENSALKYDLSQAKLYVPEDKKASAEIKYEMKGNPVLSVILAVVLFVAMAVVLIYYMPEILSFIEKIIDTFQKL